MLTLVRSLPRKSDSMDVLRTAVSALGLYDPDARDNSREANLRKAVRIQAQVPTLVAAWSRIRKGKAPIPPSPRLSLAGNLLYMLSGRKPSALAEKAMDTALILHADHELNASTFASRVTVATLSDMYSGVVSGIGTLKGPLHGGANVGVMRMLLEIGDVDRAETWIKNALAQKKRIMGFGHRVYHTEDPRATHLRRLSEQLGREAGELKWFEMSRIIERVVNAEKGPARQRRLLLRVDLLLDGHRPRPVHADLRGLARLGMDGAHPGAAGPQPPDPAARRVPGLAPGDLRPPRPALTASEASGCPAPGR